MVLLFSYTIFSEENFTVVAAKFHENRLRIDWEIGEKHAIHVVAAKFHENRLRIDCEIGEKTCDTSYSDGR